MVPLQSEAHHKVCHFFTPIFFSYPIDSRAVIEALRRYFNDGGK